MKAILRAGAYELVARADVPDRDRDQRICRRRQGLLRRPRDRLRQRPARRHRERGAASEASAEVRLHRHRLRALATDPAARGLLDDAAVLEVGGETLVLTHDMIVEGVHYPARRSARRRRLEAGRGEPLRPRRQGRAAARRAARLHARRRGLGPGLRRRASARRSRPSACPCSAATPSAAPARVLGLTAIGRAAARCRRAGAARGPAICSGSAARSATPAPGFAMLQGRARRLRRPGRALPQPAPAARGRASGWRRWSGDDGRLRRPADRRRAHGRGERLRGRDRARCACRCPTPIWRCCGEARLEAATRRRRLRAAVRRRRRRGARRSSRWPTRSACPSRGSAASRRAPASR